MKHIIEVLQLTNIDEIETEITRRIELKLKMTGQLYPSILNNEIADLKQLIQSLKNTESTTIFDNQKLYAQKNKLPLFAYQKCPRCSISLQVSLTKNLTLQQAELKASSELFTGCNNCGMSWCD